MKNFKLSKDGKKIIAPSGVEFGVEILKGNLLDSDEMRKFQDEMDRNFNKVFIKNICAAKGL